MITLHQRNQRKSRHVDHFASQPMIALIGRILLAAIFLLSGINKLMNFGGTTALMHSAGLPIPELLLVSTILIEVFGALMLIFGWQTRAAALVVFIFMIPVTLVFHNPWAAAENAVMQQMIHFLKNLAIMGGLLNLLAVGAGVYSVDAHRVDLDSAERR